MLGFENRKFGDTYIFGKYVGAIFFVNILHDKGPVFLFLFLDILFLTSFVNPGYKYITGLKIANDAFTNKLFFCFVTFYC